LLFALVGFIISTVLANFVGYIFNFFVGVVGKLLNFSETFMGAFKERPLEFLIFLVLFLAIVVFMLMKRSQWKVKNIDPIAGILGAFVALFFTYVTTLIYSEIRGDKAPAEAASVEPKKAEK
jgi:hypothetical protein